MIYLLAIIIFIVLLLAILFGVAVMLPVLTTGVPFVPTSKKVIQALLDMTNPKPGQTIYDLGSGNGAILFRCPKTCERHGYELNGILHLWATWRNTITKNNIHFHKQDLFKADYSKVDIITCYLFPHIMERIEKEIWPLLPANCKMAVHGFPLPNTPYKKMQKVGRNTIYLYVR